MQNLIKKALDLKNSIAEYNKTAENKILNIRFDDKEKATILVMNVTEEMKEVKVENREDRIVRFYEYDAGDFITETNETEYLKK